MQGWDAMSKGEVCNDSMTVTKLRTLSNEATLPHVGV